MGAKLPQDRIYDGKDISDVLFHNGTSPHECLFIYKGSPNYNCPQGMNTCPGLWAVRCGVYKMQCVFMPCARWHRVLLSPVLLA